MQTPSLWPRRGRTATVLLGLVGLVITGGVRLADATTPSDASAYVPTSPCRLVDTRPGNDNVGSRATPLGPDETLTLDGRGPHGNCAGASLLPDSATGLQLNVTALNATQATFLTLFPNGGERPLASHLNPVPGGPPTPNSVTVKLADNGRFDLYNRFGNVDVIIDVVGHYTGHHHDDRYYTRAEVDALTAGEPWSIDVSAGEVVMVTDNADIVSRRLLPPDEFQSVTYGIRVPDDYTPGADLLVDLSLYFASGPACGLTLSLLEAFTSNADRTVLVPQRFVNPSDPMDPFRTVLDLGATEIHNTVIVPIRIEGDTFEPGDWVGAGFARIGLHADDTCAADVNVIGLTVREA